MPTPKDIPVDALLFENAIETAIRTVMLKNGLNDPKTQRQYAVELVTETGKKEQITLTTPRVEVRAQFNGFLRQYYIARQGTADATPYQCRQRGQVMFRVVTHRKFSAVDVHAKLRGAVRAMMMNQKWQAITDLMKQHRLVESIESGTTLTINTDEFQDVSAMSFDSVVDIRGEVFEALYA